jgi:gliding motility-associated protein GldE
MNFHAPGSWSTWIIIVCIALLCLVVSAFVSGSEIAYFGLTLAQRKELEEQDSASSKIVTMLLNNSERLLATILISNNLVNISLVILLAYAINLTIEFDNAVVQFLLQTVFLTFILLLFGEIIPKLIARGRMMNWALSSAHGINVLYRFFAPISRIMVKSTSIVGRIVTKRTENISTEELSQALEISDVEEEKDKEMLEGILSLGEKGASDIMIARVDITAIEYHASWREVMEVILQSGFSRIPIYNKNRDAIQGILYSKDLLAYIDRANDSFAWQKLIRKAYFVPETRRIDDLLEDFRRKKIHIAIVVDEYGCTQGIVTLEDILEEIVGEIDDEYDSEDRLYKKIGDNTYLFKAKIPLPDFFRITDIEEDTLDKDDEAETLAGLVLAIKGDFPKVGEVVERSGIEFKVMKMERHRIITVEVKLPENADSQQEE